MTTPNPVDESDSKKYANEVWHYYLTHGRMPKGVGGFLNRTLGNTRLMRLIPSEPRCRICQTPFQGLGGQLYRVTLGRAPSKMNPQMCNACEMFAHYFRGGAEIEISMLFADVRGSTTLAEGLSPAAFSELIDRFYQVATHALIHSNALIEKLIGDEVTGLYTPGFAGPHHAQRAVAAAQQILRDTGHDQANGPWIPVGVGVHTGLAFIGSVGQANGMTDIAALGDAVNTAARIASQAKKGEVLVSEAARQNGQLTFTNHETRQLQLKGKTEPMHVWVLPVTSPS